MLPTYYSNNGIKALRNQVMYYKANSQLTQLLCYIFSEFTCSIHDYYIICKYSETNENKLTSLIYIFHTQLIRSTTQREYFKDELKRLTIIIRRKNFTLSHSTLSEETEANKKKIKSGIDHLGMLTLVIYVCMAI